jgi:hypothetical protein
MLSELTNEMGRLDVRGDSEKFMLFMPKSHRASEFRSIVNYISHRNETVFERIYRVVVVVFSRRRLV